METSNPHQIGQNEQRKPQIQFRHHLRRDASEECSSPPSRAGKAESSEASVALLLQDQELLIPRGWPTRPKIVRSSLQSTIFDVGFDVILFACSAAFLALALIVKKQDGAFAITEYEKHEPIPIAVILLSATKYGPTVFPILFASVLGRMTHTILCWRLAKGEKMGILDTLAASTSFTSTVTSQIQMRRLNYLGICLVAIWALSPVGGQATLRLMSIRPRENLGKDMVRYMVPTGNIQGYETTNGPWVIEKVNSLFMSTLILSSIDAGDGYQPKDPYRNIRIMKAQPYGTGDSSNADKDGWYNVFSGSSSAYFALVGIPRESRETEKMGGYYDHYIQTSYLDLKCFVSNSSLNGTRDSDLLEFRGTGATIRYSNDSLVQRAGVAPDILQPFNFYYYPAYNTSTGQNPLSCDVRSVYVESNIECRESGCALERVRASRLDHHPSAWTLLDLRPSYWPFFLESFISSIKGRENEPSLMDQYIANPTFGLADRSMTGADNTSPEDYSIRLGQLLNTYFYLLNGMSTIPLILLPNTKGFENTIYLDNNQSFIPHFNHTTLQDNFGPNGPAIRLWETEIIVQWAGDSIVAHQGWIATLAIISSLLVLASLVTPIIRTFFLHGPDVMMNVSSLARYDTHLKLPVNGSHLNAAERAKLLQDVKIKLGDVEREKKVGRLAIGSVQGADNFDIADCRKGRLYD